VSSIRLRFYRGRNFLRRCKKHFNLPTARVTSSLCAPKVALVVASIACHIFKGHFESQYIRLRGLP
jgi:hypothetical protein